AADGRGSAALFAYPTGIWGDGNNLFITDVGNYNVRKVDLRTGNVTTIAGSGSSAITDGTGTAAKFVGPTGIWGQGSTLYVADTYSTSARALRRIDITTGAVTTVADLGAVSTAPTAGVGIW